MPFFSDAVFFRSVHDLGDLPPDRGIEIAFAGRSNAGKSSAINALVGRKRLAFISKMPGRTQCLNFFSVGPSRYFVDLPGYGYAAAPAWKKSQWEKLIGAYLQTRVSLHGLVLIMDSRHPVTALDRQLLDWWAPLRKPVHILLTKADKLGQQEAAAALRAARSFADDYPSCTVQLFSGTAKTGVAAAQKFIARWCVHKKPPVKGE